MGLMMMIILVTVLVVTVEYVFTPLLLSLRFLEVGLTLFNKRHIKLEKLELENILPVETRSPKVRNILYEDLGTSSYA